MNRPNPKDYATYGEYDVAMNKYCDEIEQQIHLRDEKIIQKNEEIMKLNKALDKACEFAESYYGHSSAENLKKSFMKEVQDEN